MKYFSCVVSSRMLKHLTKLYSLYVQLVSLPAASFSSFHSFVHLLLFFDVMDD